MESSFRHALVRVAVGFAAARTLYRYLRRRDVRRNSVGFTTSAEARQKVQSFNVHNCFFVLDFDRTMTTPGSSQCHHLFARETGQGLPPQVVEDFRDALQAKTKPVRKWTKMHSLLVEYGLRRADLESIVGACGSVQPRRGLQVFLKRLESARVPVLVVSAGIENVIELYLRKWKCLSENMSISSNRMIFDEDGVLSAFEAPLVTSRNKALTYSNNRAFFDGCLSSGRRCIVIIGDKPSDASIARGLPKALSPLCVGFYNAGDPGVAHATATASGGVVAGPPTSGQDKKLNGSAGSRSSGESLSTNQGASFLKYSSAFDVLLPGRANFFDLGATLNLYAKPS